MSPLIYWISLAMAFMSGALMPLQAGINGLLAKEISSVLNAATLSFVVGTAALLTLALIKRDWVSVQAFKIYIWHWAVVSRCFLCLYCGLCCAAYWCHYL